MFLMDYEHRARIKVWGRARVVNDPTLLARLTPSGYKARPEQAIVFGVTAWDANCHQHIPQLVHVESVAPLVKRMQHRIEALSAQLREHGIEPLDDELEQS